jgi:hypothetical protein
MRKYRINFYHLLLAALLICAVALPGTVDTTQAAAGGCIKIPNPPLEVDPGVSHVIPPATFVLGNGGFYDFLSASYFPPSGTNVLYANPSTPDRPEPISEIFLPGAFGYMHVTLINWGPEPIDVLFQPMGTGFTVLPGVSKTVKLMASGITGATVFQHNSGVMFVEVCYD